MSSMRPQIFTRGPSGLSQTVDATSPADQRDDAKRNFLKSMRPLPTQHYWNIYFDRSASPVSRHSFTAEDAANGVQPPTNTPGRQSKDNKPNDDEYHVELEQLGSQIESVQDFWRYNNNTPVDQIKMRESIYLFKSGFRPVWEDRRNLNGGSWTLRVPKTAGPDVWTRVQLLAIGEKLQSALEEGLFSQPSFELRLTHMSRRPALRRRPLGALQLPPHNHLAPRLVQEGVRRRHACLHHGGAAVGFAAQTRQLLLQAPLRPRRLQGPARAQGARGRRRCHSQGAVAARCESRSALCELRGSEERNRRTEGTSPREEKGWDLRRDDFSERNLRCQETETCTYIFRALGPARKRGGLPVRYDVE